MSVRTEFVDFVEEPLRGGGGGTRSYAELCKAMETAAPAPHPHPHPPIGAPVASFAPIETKRAPAKPAERASTVSSIFEGMTLNATAPTAGKPEVKTLDKDSSSANAGPQSTIKKESAQPNPGAAAVDVKAEELLNQQTIAEYEAAAKDIDILIGSIGIAQKKRKGEKKATKSDLKKEYGAIGEVREMADNWASKLDRAKASEQKERLEKQREAIRELVSVNRAEFTELTAAEAAKEAEKKRLAERAIAEDKTVEQVKKEEADAARTAKAEAAKAAKAEAAAARRAAAPKKKTPEEQMREEYAQYEEAERAADPGAMVIPYEEFAANKKAQQKADAAAKAQLTKAYNKYKETLPPGLEPMTVEAYEEKLKQQKRDEEAAAKEEADRRERLGEQGRAEEDAENARIAKEATAAKAAASKAYRQYVKDTMGEATPADTKSLEWKAFVAKAVENKQVLPEAAWSVAFKNKKAMKEYKKLLVSTENQAEEGERDYKGPEFYQRLIETLEFELKRERMRLGAMTETERMLIPDYAAIVQTVEGMTTELMKQLEAYKAIAEAAAKTAAENEAKAKAAEAEAAAKAAQAAAKAEEAAAEEEKAQWVRDLRKPYEDAMMGMYELRWNLLSDMKEEAQQYLDKLKAAPVADSTNPNYDENAVTALQKDLVAVLDAKGWVQNMTACLQGVSEIPCLQPTTAVDAITKKAYDGFKDQFNKTKADEAEYNAYAEKAGDSALEYEYYLSVRDDYYAKNGTASPEDFAAHVREIAATLEEEADEADDGEQGEEGGEEDVEMQDAENDHADLDDDRGTLVQFTVKVAEPYVADPTLSEDAQNEAKTEAKARALFDANKFVKRTLVPKLSDYMRDVSFLFPPTMVESEEMKHNNIPYGVFFRLAPNATKEEADNQVREVARATFPSRTSADTDYVWLSKVPFPTPMRELERDSNGVLTGNQIEIGAGIFQNSTDAFEKRWNANGTVDIRVAIEPLTQDEWPAVDSNSPDLSRTEVPQNIRYVPAAMPFGASASGGLALTERTVPISGTAEDKMRDYVMEQAMAQAVVDGEINKLLAKYLRSVSPSEWKAVIDERVIGFEVEPKLELTEYQWQWLKSYAPEKMNLWDTELSYNQKRSLLLKVQLELERQDAEQASREKNSGGKAIDQAGAQRRREMRQTEKGATAIEKEIAEEIENQWQAYLAEEKAAGNEPIPKKAFVKQKRKQLEKEDEEEAKKQ